MHEPKVLLWDIRPLRLDVWHVEPDGHDSGEVCGHWKNTRRAEIAFALRHWRHLQLRWWPYRKVRRWLRDRCAECGRRFFWKGDARHGYMGSDEVYHDTCMSLRHVRGQLGDLTGHVLGTADWNANRRAEYRLKGITGERENP